LGMKEKKETKRYKGNTDLGCLRRRQMRAAYFELGDRGSDSAFIYCRRSGGGLVW
jgi:hypothetical protein